LHPRQPAFVPAREAPPCGRLSGPADACIEAGLAYAFAPGDALWRIDTAPDGARPALRFMFHHVFMDGEAALSLIRDLLAYWGEGKAIPLRTLGCLNQKSAPRQIFRALWQGMAQERQYRRQATHDTRALPTAESRVIDLSIPADQVRIIQKATRQRRTTRNSLLQAALALAYARGSGGDYALLRGMAFANQRPKLRPKPDPTQLGAGITLIPYLVDPALDLWTLSQSLQQQAHRTLARGGHFAMNWLSPWIIGMGLRSAHRMGDVALSFSGAIPSTGTFGAIRMTSIRSYISSHRKAPPFSGWAQIDPAGDLHFCFSYHSLPPQKAAAVCEALGLILQEME
ncbi:MAG: hypothetical protein D6722_16735, partial [Bacteroidetes bacterium]